MVSASRDIYWNPWMLERFVASLKILMYDWKNAVLWVEVRDHHH